MFKVRLAECLNRFLIVKTLVGVFNQEKALVNCETVKLHEGPLTALVPSVVLWPTLINQP